MHVLLSDNLARSFGIETTEEADAAARAFNLGLAHFPDGKPITWKSLLSDNERREAANWWKKQRAQEAAATPRPQQQPVAPAPMPLPAAADSSEGNEVFIDAICDYVERAVMPLAQKIVELEKKLGVVEERMLKGFDRGVWQMGETYDKGEWVTFDGQLWIAQTKTADRPPTLNWRLAVKKGRDGRGR